MRGVTGLLVLVLFATLTACGQSKPSGSDYLAKWRGNTQQLSCECLLNISRNGESFVIRDEPHPNKCYNQCTVYEGIYVLTPEGNLQGGMLGRISVSVDKGSNRLLFSGGPGGLEYMAKAQ